MFNKWKVCEEVGFVFCFFDLFVDMLEEKLFFIVDDLNVDNEIDGILV